MLTIISVKLDSYRGELSTNVLLKGDTQAIVVFSLQQYVRSSLDSYRPLATETMERVVMKSYLLMDTKTNLKP